MSDILSELRDTIERYDGCDIFPLDMDELKQAADEIERLRGALLNIQALAERGNPIDSAKLATRCRCALNQQETK